MDCKVILSPKALLPADLEQATIEQVVLWFSNRDRVGGSSYRSLTGKD
jgi:hypothetical protein